MNSTDTTSGCYLGSRMRSNNLANARSAFNNAFGESFIPSHSGCYSNKISEDDVPSGWAWRDISVELMSEEQVYGHSAWGAANHNGYDVGTQKTQFRLFSLDKTKINIREAYWLINVQSSSSFAFMNDDGSPFFTNASRVLGVRPFACIVGDPD
jgi:hypothetical protein